MIKRFFISWSGGILAIVVVALLIMAGNTHADNSIMFEIGIGVGGSGSVTKTEEEMKRPYNVIRWCKNRPSKRLMFGAIRLRQNVVELHAAKWWHDSKSDANCNRGTNAIGLGLVLQSSGSSYVSWTPGISYTWGEDKEFTNRENENTNWKLYKHWQPFNRFAVGNHSDTQGIEFAYNRYGLDNDHAETFATVGFMARTVDQPNNQVTPTGEEPPVSDPPGDTDEGGSNCNNGGGNGSEGCNASENGNDDE